MEPFNTNHLTLFCALKNRLGVFSIRCLCCVFNLFSETKELRLSYDICDEEKEFLKKRNENVLKNFSKLGLGENTPKNKQEVSKYTRRMHSALYTTD